MSVHPQVAPALAGSVPGPLANRPIRVVLADDHTLMRRSLRLLLDDEDSIDVVAEADDLSSALRHVQDHLPHVLVLDLSISNGTSIEAIRRLRVGMPGTAIVVLTMEESTVFAHEALDAGAIGFVVKHAADAELAEGVRSAARGEQYVSPRVAGRVGPLGRVPLET